MSHYRAAAEGGGGGERTRLLFTGLHPSVESSHLSSHIAQCPSSSSSSSISVTDVKVVKRRDGTSRCIAFAGFRSSRDAERVLEWSNQTWVSGARGGSRVKVDWAKDTREAGSEPVAKRKKFDHAASTSQQQQQDSTKRGGDTSDSRFKEFLSVMAPPKPSAVHDTTTIEDSQIRSTGDSSSAGGGGGEDDDAATSKQDEKRKSSSNGHERDALGLDSTAGTTTTTREDDHVAEDETLTDAEYLAKRMKRTFDQVEAEPADDDDQVENGKAFEQDDEDRPGHENVDENDAGGQDGRAEGASPSRDLTIESILETGRLFVRNLAFSATQQDLETLFSRYGRLEQVHIPVDKATGQPKGLAYVQFEAPWTESSVEAYRALDGTTFQGRLLHILPAVGRAQRPEQDRRDGGGNALKRERLDARKETGGKAFSWATLYLNSNAALSAVADRLGVSKAELLDPTSSSDPAIKVALAEAHTIGEIKQYFENEGVNIEAFGQPGPKSSTCILIKNLPYATSAGSLQLLVSPFTGEQGPRRLLVPPSGTIAIVDFHDANVARDAWRGLLYKQFGGSVLYLEKAPNSIWDAGSASQHDKNETTGIAPVVKATGRDDGGGGGEAATTTKGATLFVKNLNFVTTTERLVASFGHLEGYQFARVQTKPDPKTPGKSLSMGYGFVGFRDVESATRALDVLNRQVLDGHELDVKFAQRGSTSADNDEQRRGGGKTKAGAKAPNETTTKMLVKNVPFEATRKELRQLFSAYGQLKSVRLPRKMDNTTRGFAFLDFATRRDAESAFGALEHAHLLGRHLVLQWAGEGDDDVEEARGKRQGEFDTARKNLTHKKSKFTLETE